MNKGIFLILLGLFAVLVAEVANNEEEGRSLSEDLSSSRTIREAGNNNSVKRKRKRKKNKKHNETRREKKIRKKEKKKERSKGRNSGKNGTKKEKEKKKQRRKNGKKNNGKSEKRRKGGKKKNRNENENNILCPSPTECPACPTCPSPTPTPAPVPAPAPTPPTSCLSAALKAMKMLKDNVGNFDKQETRIGKQTGIAAKKAEKKDAFSSLVSTLVTVGGGNKNNLTCAGKSSGDGVTQLKNLTETLTNCMMMVNSTCNTTTGAFAEVNMTMVDECKKITTDYKVTANELKE